MENVAIPAIEPRMSRRYASRASNLANLTATPCAIAAIVAAVARKMNGNITQVGRPCSWMPK